MAKKKETTTEHFVHLLLEPYSGLSIVYNSDVCASLDRDVLESHLNTKISIIKIPYCYDRMPTDTLIGIVAELKNIDGLEKA